MTSDEPASLADDGLHQVDGVLHLLHPCRRHLHLVLVEDGLLESRVDADMSETSDVFCCGVAETAAHSHTLTTMSLNLVNSMTLLKCRRCCMVALFLMSFGYQVSLPALSPRYVTMAWLRHGAHKIEIQ